MQATITGRLSDRTVQGLRALGVMIRFLQFDKRTGLPVHQFTTGGTADETGFYEQSGSGADADYRALGAGRGSGSDGRRGDVAVDRPVAGRCVLGDPDVRVGVAAAGQGSSDISQ